MSKVTQRTIIAIGAGILTYQIVGLAIFLWKTGFLGLIVLSVVAGAGVWLWDWYTDRTTP